MDILCTENRRFKKSLTIFKMGTVSCRNWTEFTMGSLEGETESSRIGNRVEF